MEKREYRHMLVDFLKKRNITMGDIFSIKKNLNVEEMFSLVDLICKKDKVSKLFFSYIDKYDDLLHKRIPYIFSGQYKEEILKREILTEIRFLTAQVCVRDFEIKDFITIRKEFEELFMRGDYNDILKIIEDFEKKYGLSFWSTDCRISTLSFMDPTKADDFYIHSIKNCNNVSVKTYLNIGRYRFLKDVTGIYFKTQQEIISQEYNEIEPDSIFKEAFKKYIKACIDITRGFDLFDIRFLLIMSDYLTVVDKYILLEKILSWLCSESVYEDNGMQRVVLECSMFLREKIDDSLWDNICILLGDDFNITIKEEKKIVNSCLSEFCVGNKNLSYELCMKELSQHSNCFPLINLLAKSGNCEVSNIPYMDLAWFVRRLYLKEDKDSEFAAIIELCDVYERIYSHFTFGNNLGVIIENETGPIMLRGKMSYVNSLINSGFIPSKLAFFLEEEKQKKFLCKYKKKVGKLFFCDWQIATYSEAREEVLQNYTCDITSYNLNQIKKLNCGQLEKEKGFQYENADIMNDNICRSFLMKMQFDSAVENDNILDAIEIYLKAFFISQLMVIKIDCNKINGRITRKLKRFLENSLSYCIYAYITRFELSKGENISETVVNSCRKILRNSENKSVLAFPIPNIEIEKKKIIFFLRNICTYECLRRVEIGVSLVQEIYNERLQVIEKIMPYYMSLQKKEDINALSKEKVKISSKIEFLDIAKCINRGKINTSWVVFSDEAQGAILSIYHMYNKIADSNALSAYVNAFAIVKKDYVQEINRILSITIRHGILEGELVRFFKRGKINLDSKNISPHNYKCVETFFQNVYDLLDILLSDYIMATYKYENETKLLLYVDEKLLKQSFLELPEEIIGPEDIEKIYKKILDTELEERLPEWGKRICDFIDMELRKYLEKLNVECEESLKDDVNKVCDLLGEEIEKLKKWFMITENQNIQYRLVTLGEMLEQEWVCVNVLFDIESDIIVTGNVINFLYTIIRELILNAEKYSGFSEDDSNFNIKISLKQQRDNLVFYVKNNIAESISPKIIDGNIRDIKQIIQSVEKADTTIFNRKDIYEGKSGYKKIVKLLKRNYEGKYQIEMEHIENEFIVKITFLLEALI